MSKRVLGIEGEIRRFTPDEVGLVIKVCRKGMGLKREALALSARVNDKTIQRAEAGERVCDKSSRRIATALGLAPDTFTMDRFVPHPSTLDETQRLERQLREEWAKSHLAITVDELRDVSDVIPLVGSGCRWVDDSNVATEHRQLFAAMKKVISEANEQAVEEILARIRDVEARGYVVKGTVIETYFSDRPFQAVTRRRTAYVVAFQKSLGTIDTTPVQGWFSKMRLLKLHGAVDANQYPGDESTVWTGRDPLGVLCGDANANFETF